MKSSAAPNTPQADAGRRAHACISFLYLLHLDLLGLIADLNK